MDSEDFVLRGKVPYPFAEMSALGRAVSFYFMLRSWI